MSPVTKTRAIILIGIVGAVLFFLHFLGALSGPEAWLMRSISGREATLANAARSFSTSIRAPFNIASILDENEELRKEREELLTEVARLKKAEEENGELRSLIEFSEREGRTPVAAHVIAQTPSSGRHTILLDKGSDDGLHLDMPVIVGNGILVGKIFKVERTTSLALLLTDTRSHVGGLIQNEDNTLGVVQGKRGLSLEMRLIPQNQDIQPGDLIVTSGIEPLIPKGLVVGKAQTVETEERNPFKRATIISPIAFDQLEIVAVLFPG